MAFRRPELGQLQRWMQAVITHPGGIDPGMASEEARHSLAVDLGTLDEVVAPSARLSSAERLAIYSRSYYARLLECFQAMFPGLLAALGRDLFNRFALDYLHHHPPSSYTLDHLADAFPRHLAETRPDADAPQEERESWPDLIIDLATLELAFQKVYDGPGTEGRTLPNERDVLAIPIARIFEARPVPVPCLCLFALRFPVHRYVLAVRREETPDIPAPAETFVAMTRRDYRVALHELSRDQHGFLQNLDGTRTVAQAQAAMETRETPRVPAARARDWLGEWAEKGFFEIF